MSLNSISAEEFVLFLEDDFQLVTRPEDSD